MNEFCDCSGKTDISSGRKGATQKLTQRCGRDARSGQKNQASLIFVRAEMPLASLFALQAQILVDATGLSRYNAGTLLGRVAWPGNIN